MTATDTDTSVEEVVQQQQSTAAMERHDFVIFGASGFTGQFVVQHLARALKKDNDETATWAISGRSEAKLRKVLAEASEATGLDLKEVPLIICDINDEESIKAMASSAKVVLNCVGPYRFLGERVVSACVKGGASHIDISGEEQFIASMHLKYDDLAKESGVFVISACGFDSIPNDLGHVVLAQSMEGDVNSVESFIKVIIPPTLGTKLNYGTWQSAIHMFHNYGEIEALHQKLSLEKLPETLPKLRQRGLLSYSEEAGAWVYPFVGPDRSIMGRTERARHLLDGERPAQVETYSIAPFGLISGLIMLFGMGFMKLMVSTRFGLNLLLNHPRMFSMGAVSKEGPSLETARNTNFKITLVGKGWKTKAAKHDSAPEREVTVKVSGKNVGYGSTSECMVQAAIAIIRERGKMPKSGGVYTPGYAFAKTSLAKRLTENGVPFEATVKDL